MPGRSTRTRQACCVVGLGAATRLLRFVTESRKRVPRHVVFGTATDTLDAAGEVTQTCRDVELTRDAVEAAARGFVGDIEQIPPMVSATEGRRATVARART